MKSTHVIIIVLVLILLGVLVFSTKDKNDSIDINAVDNTGAVNNTPNTSNTSGTNTNVSGGVSAGVNLSGEVKEFTVTASNFKFSPNIISVNRGDKVRIVFKNTEGFHDFRIDEYAAVTSQLRAPGEEVVEFVADKVGAFEYYCSVGTHRQMGMKGTFNVN